MFGDIQETQFSGSKMEVHVHLKISFPGGICNRRIRLATIFGLPPTPRRWAVFEGKFDNGILRCFQFNFLRPVNYAFDRLDWTTARWYTPNMSVAYPSSGVCVLLCFVTESRCGSATGRWR